jgi:hypothetical protein
VKNFQNGAVYRKRGSVDELARIIWQLIVIANYQDYNYWIISN